MLTDGIVKCILLRSEHGVRKLSGGRCLKSERRRQVNLGMRRAKETSVEVSSLEE